MIERGVDRAEERPAVTSPLDIGQRVGGAVKVLVLPAVIAGHALHIADIDHPLVRKTDGRGGKATSFSASILRTLMPRLRLPLWPSLQSPQRPRAPGSRDRIAPCGRPTVRLCRGRR